MSGVLLPDIHANQYYGDELGDQPTLSASIANILLTQSPAHARANHPRLNPDYQPKTEPKFDLGTVVHSLLLEGMSVMDVHAFPDWRTNAAKEAAATSRAHGRIPLLSKDAHAVTEMVNAVAAQLEQLDVDPVPLTNGKPEQTITWTENGVACRARIDWLHDDLSAVDDLKTTTRSASPKAWERNLHSYGCETQAAFYLRGLRAITGATPAWRWLVVEVSPPYALSVVTPGADVLALGDAKIDRALEIWKRCLDTGEWPAYGNGVHVAELPPWLEAQWLEREALYEAAA